MPDPYQNDDGNPYAGRGALTPDSSGSTRVGIPDPREMRPGIRPRVVPKEFIEHQGTYGRAPLNSGRPVEPTALPFDPTRFAGVVPSRIPDPRSTIGSSTEIKPAHVTMARLKSQGAEEWMFAWVQARGQLGMWTDDQMLRQCDVLAHYGDQIAPRLAYYMRQVNNAIARAQQSQRQRQAARMGVLPPGR